MVWLHGGAFTVFSGSQPVGDGTAQARDNDVVVVTLNHRLGILGYLHLGDMAGGAYATSGNAGLLDLVFALTWISDNISAFGGDPDNVMIFGCSGGGLKVSALLAMPAARGLFHRAVIQSGPGLRFDSVERAGDRAKEALAVLGLDPDRVEDLHSLPVDRLIEAQVALVHRAGGRPGTSGDFGFSPHIDGDVLPTQPGEAIATGASGNIPLIIGTTREEVTRLLPSLEPIDDETLHQHLRPRLADRTDEVITTYRETSPTASNFDIFCWILTDQLFRATSIKMAELKIAGGTAPVYMYFLTWPSPAMEGKAKAIHSMCNALVMNNPEADVVTNYPSAQSVAESMSTAWAAFARSGDPNAPGLPAWPAYSTSRRATMIFDEACRVEDDPDTARRLAWAGLPLADEIYGS